jgi:hypothetical protein
MTCCGAVIGSLLALVSAHPGGLDAYGGHVDQRTGKYHFHRAPLTSPRAQALPIPRPRRVGVFFVSAKPHPETATPPAVPVDQTFPPLPTTQGLIEQLQSVEGGNGLWAQALAMEAKQPPPGQAAGSYLYLSPVRPEAPRGQLTAMRCLAGTMCPMEAQARAEAAVLSPSERLDEPALRFLLRAESDGWYLLGLHLAFPSCGEPATIAVTQGAQMLVALESPSEGALTVPALVQLSRGQSYLFDVAVSGPPAIFRALTVDRV